MDGRGGKINRYLYRIKMNRKWWRFMFFTYGTTWHIEAEYMYISNVIIKC